MSDSTMRQDGLEIKKLYPEENAQARFKISGTKKFAFYCNHHGFFCKKL
ncbi:hypothetical protein [Treponema sp. C6A8]|nr:hypothetical protein [Treponema sp. C6A8]